MTVLTGVLIEAERKQSKAGNPYYRLNIQADGETKWWTYFGELHGAYVSAACLFSLRELGNGEIVDSYEIQSPGQPPPSEAPAQTLAPGGTPIEPTPVAEGPPGYVPLTEQQAENFIAKDRAAAERPPITAPVGATITRNDTFATAPLTPPAVPGVAPAKAPAERPAAPAVVGRRRNLIVRPMSISTTIELMPHTDTVGTLSSNLQSEPQPSPFAVLPSSHSSQCCK